MFTATSSKKRNSLKSDKKLAQTIKGLGSVDLLMYLGSFTQDTVTGIDILVVGDVNKTQVHNFIADLEDEEGRELKYVVMSTEEFRYRQDVNDRFVTIVQGAKKTIVHDPNDFMKEKKQPKQAIKQSTNETEEK